MSAAFLPIRHLYSLGTNLRHLDSVGIPRRSGRILFRIRHTQSNSRLPVSRHRLFHHMLHISPFTAFLVRLLHLCRGTQRRNHKQPAQHQQPDECYPEPFKTGHINPLHSSLARVDRYPARNQVAQHRVTFYAPFSKRFAVNTSGSAFLCTRHIPTTWTYLASVQSACLLFVKTIVPATLVA